MNHRMIWATGITVALGLALALVPGDSLAAQWQYKAPRSTAGNKIVEIEAELAYLRALKDQQPVIVDSDAEAGILARELEKAVELSGDQDTVRVLSDLEEGSVWLGVEIREVEAEKAKELKLPAERGVLLSSVVADSPAAKAGLKEKDVITEVNGVKVEGVVQFRRLIRETPAGRSIQLGIVRDGRAQTLTATLGRGEERKGMGWFASPSRTFSFRMPEIPELPAMRHHGNVFELMRDGRPRLGIDGEDLNGQLAAYFGAPDGEGILVREVHSGSAAEKAGIKAGDVLTKFNGERIRTLGDLREKLAGISEKKTAKIGLLRNHSELSVDVNIEPPEKPKVRTLTRVTNI